MMAEVIYGSLDITVPDFHGHIIARACQYISVIRRKFDFAYCQLMSHKSHQRLVDICPQIENLDQIVRTGRCYEVFVLVEVNAQNIVVVGSDALDVLAGAQIPDSTALVATAAGENALVCWVPDCLVY